MLIDWDAALAKAFPPPLGDYFPGARPNQIPPDGDWLTWLIVAGRGFGKTRVGAEWIVEQADTPGTRWAIVARTFADCRDTCIEGESGVLRILRRRQPDVDWAKRWNRSIGELTLPNDSLIRVFSAEDPDRLRGPQFHGAWCDEPASWNYGIETWDMLQFTLRLGDRPRTVVTGTPAPVELVKNLIGRARQQDPTVHLTVGRTLDNIDNLAASAVAELQARYAGTRLGRQELEGELLEDTPGALWTLNQIATDRVENVPCDLMKIVVGVDPSGGEGETHDEQGIVVVGLGLDGEGYVLADRSCRLSPEGWARQAIAAYHDFEADGIVAETNYGGDMVGAVIRAADPTVPVVTVSASRGKRQRAEPIALMYEQHRIHHVGEHKQLEDQMTSWVPTSGKSPDRMDALVWALTETMALSWGEGVYEADDDTRVRISPY